MKKNKYIKQIAKNLPVVVDQTVSGYYLEDGKPVPNIVSHPLNHERRLRKAYEQLGMEGVKQYLHTIYNLQLKHNENLHRLDNVQDEKVLLGDNDQEPGDQPVPDQHHPVTPAKRKKRVNT